MDPNTQKGCGKGEESSGGRQRERPVDEAQEDRQSQPANNPLNLDDPRINQALMMNRGAANQLDEDHVVINQQAPNQQHLVRNQNYEANNTKHEEGPGGGVDLLRDEDVVVETEERDQLPGLEAASEPSNFQAWYIRSPQNRNKGEQAATSEQDQDMEENDPVPENDGLLQSQDSESSGGGASRRASSTANGAFGISGGGGENKQTSAVSFWESVSGASNVTVNSSSWISSAALESSAGSSKAAMNAVAASLPWLGAHLNSDKGNEETQEDDEQNVIYRSADNRDYELSMLNRADRSERLEKLYRSLSLEPSEQRHQVAINQNRVANTHEQQQQGSSITNMNLAALAGAIPRSERRNAAYLNSNSQTMSVSVSSSAAALTAAGCSTTASGPPPPSRSTASGSGVSLSSSAGSLGSCGTLYNWQASKSSVHERFSFMFNNELLADIHFKVGRPGCEQRIPAHKFVLSVGSAVFDAMFNSALAMSEDEISLPDVEPQAFLALLNFLYSDEVQIGPETVMSTLYTAKKYAVPTLERHCVDFLKKNLSPDNACMLLTQARLFDEPQLATLCLEMIDNHTPEALSADGFTDLDEETLSVVLDRDTLRMKESKLFGAVLRWAEAQCQRQSLPLTGENKRNTLGRLLFQIRFPLMTVKEFAQGPAQSGVLTDKETVSLFLHYTVNLKPPDGFLDVPRCSMSGQELSICRFQQIESRWGYSGSSDKIRFIVDTRIFVVGFGLYGSIHGPSEYDVTIQLLHTGSGRILGSNEITFNSDGSNSCFRVMFKEPLEVQPGTNYTAVATLKGLDSHYGTKGQRKVSLECHSGEKVTFQFSYAAGQNNGTSVEDGQIPEIIFYI